jgi:hypothetical protein
MLVASVDLAAADMVVPAVGVVEAAVALAAAVPRGVGNGHESF